MLLYGVGYSCRTSRVVAASEYGCFEIRLRHSSYFPRAQWKLNRHRSLARDDSDNGPTHTNKKQNTSKSASLRSPRPPPPPGKHNTRAGVGLRCSLEKDHNSKEGIKKPFVTVSSSTMFFPLATTRNLRAVLCAPLLLLFLVVVVVAAAADVDNGDTYDPVSAWIDGKGRTGPAPSSRKLARELHRRLDLGSTTTGAAAAGAGSAAGAASSATTTAAAAAAAAAAGTQFDSACQQLRSMFRDQCKCGSTSSSSTDDIDHGVDCRYGDVQVLATFKKESSNGELDDQQQQLLQQQWREQEVVVTSSLQVCANSVCTTIRYNRNAAVGCDVAVVDDIYDAAGGTPAFATAGTMRCRSCELCVADGQELGMQVDCDNVDSNLSTSNNDCVVVESEDDEPKSYVDVDVDDSSSQGAFTDAYEEDDLSSSGAGVRADAATSRAFLLAIAGTMLVLLVPSFAPTFIW